MPDLLTHLRGLFNWCIGCSLSKSRHPVTMNLSDFDFSKQSNQEAAFYFFAKKTPMFPIFKKKSVSF